MQANNQQIFNIFFFKRSLNIPNLDTTIKSSASLMSHYNHASLAAK